MSVDFVAIKLALEVSGYEFSYLWVKASLHPTPTSSQHLTFEAWFAMKNMILTW